MILDPYVARLTMGNPDALQYSFQYAPLGIGNYSHYTPYAIVFLPMLVFAAQLSKVERIAAFAVLCGGALAVYLSSFTMAIVLITASIFLGLTAFSVYGKGSAVIRITAVGLILIIAGYALLFYSNSVEQLSFVFSKFERLIDGFMSVGFVQGDETKRSAWFAQEMGYFFSKNPFFGYIYGSTDYMAHGHSSLGDTLVLFGFTGLFWIIVLTSLFYLSWKSAESKAEKYAVAGSYLLLAAGGVLNPAWYSPNFIVPLSVFTLVKRNPQL
ncbi:MAG: hypothetical protein ACYC9O_06865 [Candidatus Latescibacterota bacterium]